MQLKEFPRAVHKAHGKLLALFGRSFTFISRFVETFARFFPFVSGIFTFVFGAKPHGSCHIRDKRVCSGFSPEKGRKISSEERKTNSEGRKASSKGRIKLQKSGTPFQKRLAGTLKILRNTWVLVLLAQHKLVRNAVKRTPRFSPQVSWPCGYRTAQNPALFPPWTSWAS